MDKRIDQSKSSIIVPTDFEIENLVIKATERFSFGVVDFRGVWGSFPSSAHRIIIDDPVQLEDIEPETKDVWSIIDEFKGG